MGNRLSFGATALVFVSLMTKCLFKCQRLLTLEPLGLLGCAWVMTDKVSRPKTEQEDGANLIATVGNQLKAKNLTLATLIVGWQANCDISIVPNDLPPVRDASEFGKPRAPD